MEEVEFVSRMPFTDLDILVDDMVLYERIHFSVIRNLLVGGSGFANSFIHLSPLSLRHTGLIDVEKIPSA